MAQRYGGKYSPQGSPQNARGTIDWPKARRNFGPRVGLKARLLMFAPLPLLFAGIGEILSGDGLGAIAELGAFAILTGSAWMLKEGIIAQTAFNERVVAKPPVFPRKLVAALLSGLGIGVATYFGWHQGLVSAVAFAAMGTGAHLLTFGLDPMKAKGLEGVSEFDNERVAQAVDKAEQLLKETLDAAKRIGDRTLMRRVENMASAARDMFRAVEEDPRDLTSARKYMGVYLRGARDATTKFADLWAKTKDQDARQDFEALLVDMEQSFDSHRESLMLEHRTDLDVEIEVLRDRLKQEGLKAQS